MAALPELTNYWSAGEPRMIAGRAYAIADACLAERERKDES